MHCSIDEAIREIEKGNMLIVTDSEGRENEGDLVMAAQDATPEAINFMTMYARGLVCAPITQNTADRLNLQQMVDNNRDMYRTAFTVSVDAYANTTTGISAADRSHTIMSLANENAKPDDFRRPGHIFPLVAKEGGVLVRAGHTEASIDLVKLAGKKPVAVICEIMNEDGSMARMGDLEKFSKHHNIKITTIESLIEYRNRQEHLIEQLYEFPIKNEYGDFQLRVFRNNINKLLHFAICKGNFTGDTTVLVRVHSENTLADVFSAQISGNSIPLSVAFDTMKNYEFAVFLYLQQGNRDEVLLQRLQHLSHHADIPTPKEASSNENKTDFDQVKGNAEPEALRTYGIGAQILRTLNVRKMIMLSKTKKNVVGLEGYGIHLEGTVEP